jgi:hypothetical protein
MSDKEIGQHIKPLRIQHQKDSLKESDTKKVCTREDVMKKFK